MRARAGLFRRPDGRRLRRAGQLVGGLGRSPHRAQDPGVAEHPTDRGVAHLGGLSDVSQGGAVVHVHADHRSVQRVGVGLPPSGQTPNVPARLGHGRNVLHTRNCSADGQLGLDKNVTVRYNTDMTNTTTDTFHTGQIVSCRSIGDYNCVWTFRVTHRTAKFVTLLDTGDGSSYRVGVKTYNGVEYALPFGSYSMAPTVRASSAA